MKLWREIRRAVRYALLYLLLRLMMAGSLLVSRTAWLTWCGRLGAFYYRVAGRSRKIAFENLQRVYGREMEPAAVRHLVRSVFVMIGKNAGDVLRAFHRFTREDLEAMRIIKGVEHLENAHRTGKGVIVLTAHIGAFELLAVDVGLRGFNPLVVGARLKNDRLNALLLRHRNRFGTQAIERGKDTVKLARTLMTGGVVAILIDQDTNVRSRFVNFFGMPCATPIGATILAMRTGAAVVPMFIHLRDDHMQQINCYPPLDLEITGDEERDLVVNTQKMSDAIEQEIRRYPAQWVWMHERWKTKPGEEVK